MFHMVGGSETDSQCIGCIIGINVLMDTHKPLHHFNDLFLSGPAIAGHLLLHLQRQ